MSNKNSKTKAFEPVDGGNGGNGGGNRQRLVIAIFVVVIAILALMLTLIVGEITKRLPEQNTTTTEAKKEGNSIYLGKNDVKLGDLLLIDEDFECDIDNVDFDNMENVKNYLSNSENSASAKIDGKYIYSLSSSNIYLSKSALTAFNKMVLDYCKTIDTSNADSVSASNLEIAWGGYGEDTVYDERDGYEADLSNFGQIICDHILGNSLTLKYYNDGHQTFIDQDGFEKNFKWIYEHAHEYGFILRYPDECSAHTGFDSKERIRLRYVGIAHATYIYEQGICLDEYLDRVKEYSYQSPLTIEASGHTYLVYYVKCTSDPTELPIPENTDPENYTVSGDNMGGFVLTVKK